MSIRAQSLILDTSSTDRETVAKQFKIQQLTFILTVLGITVAEYEQHGVALGGYMLWLGVGVLSWLLRVGLFVVVHHATPQEIERSGYLKFIPLLIVCIAGAYWFWTVQLISDTGLSMATLVLCVGFMSTTIAMTAMWFGAKVPVIIYNVSLWGSLSYSLHEKAVASLTSLLVLNVIVFLILWLFVVLKAREIKAHLRRADHLSELSRGLLESNRMLERMEGDAKRDVQSRAIFFAEATHDFKQRLHSAKMVVLTGRALVLQKRNALDAIERLGEELDALDSYIVNLLSFARSEAQDMKPRLRTVALQDVFQALDLQFEAEAETAGKALRFRPPGLQVATDRFTLERMLGNLVSNALRFSRRAVLVGARRRAMGISIEVWDQGPGIEEPMLRRIFEPFQQASNKPTDRQLWTGAGLGLAVVKRLSSRLNYSVSVDSRLGFGTVMRIWIPDGFVVGPEERCPRL
ncbi:Signal transduction histidine kinase [Variovorax sp. HW608]|uniref:sensor histidine kinase n=1 Tax=Variovorax sp. HW608 TaxID=1034889 RepID=UPI00081FEADC|nr:HAMP domain-containing sensor histidine kinase [Variovorax sp. HW608]SCK09056.1 Signal transduction histidine kinase [Variovorax sp. HW608]